MKKQAEARLKSAQDDLLTIQEIINNPFLTNVVAYHAQQAIEKCLKAVIEETAEIVPRIHNLITLKALADRHMRLEIESDAFDQINELYVDSRYPTDLGYLPNGKPSAETAFIFKETADELFKQISQALSKTETA
jgi:HEPN domain-containing protein